MQHIGRMQRGVMVMLLQLKLWMVLHLED